MTVVYIILECDRDKLYYQLYTPIDKEVTFHISHWEAEAGKTLEVPGW